MKRLCRTLLVLIGFVGLVRAGEVDPRIAEAEARRIAVIERVRPAVVAVFGRSGRGGGSGVLISADGYALTNFHVVRPAGKFMLCGLPDGKLYDAVVVGLDPVGDVALIKLLPKAKGDKFPFAPMGDSDKVRVGDWSLAMGNPFLLAKDFTPTITYGIISGTHRYQYPAGTILEYTDCIQFDTSINPGNSGGPLFNLDGEIIGINGRGSFGERGRINSGVGYAISINQIKNFLGHLRGGWIVDHASLGAVVRTDADGQLLVTQVLSTSPVARRGLEPGDELIRFAGRPLRSVNQFKNVLGIYPKGWRLPLVFRHYDEDSDRTIERRVLVRLMGVSRDLQMNPRRRPVPRPRPGQPNPVPPAKDESDQDDSIVAKFYEEKPGFANYYFNRLERDRVMAAVKALGDFSDTATWHIAAEVIRPIKKSATLEVQADRARMKLDDESFEVEPLKPGISATLLREPAGSGGLLVALYHWRRFLVRGIQGFEGGVYYGGHEPFYPDGTPASRTEAEVLTTDHAAATTKWFFSRDNQRLLGLECYIEKDDDPCEVIFFDFRRVDGRELPHRLTVRYGEKEYGVFVVQSYRLTDASADDSATGKP